MLSKHRQYANKMVKKIAPSFHACCLAIAFLSAQGCINAKPNPEPAISKPGQTGRIDLSKAIIYNHHLMGRPAALIDEQDINVTPAGCGSWYQQRPDSVYCFNGYNAPFATDDPNLPWPASISFDLRGNYKLTEVYIYVEDYQGQGRDKTTNNELRLRAGTPYKWEDSIVTLKKDGTSYDKWVKVPVRFNHATRFIHLETDQYFGIIRELVLYGTMIDTIPRPAPVVKIKPGTYHRFGTNATLGDGKGKDYLSKQQVDYSVKFDNVRIFGGLRYYVDSSDNLMNKGKALNDLEGVYADVYHDNHVNYFYTMAGLTALSQIDPAKKSDGNLIDRKAIDYKLCKGSRTIAGIEVCDNVAGLPASYDHIAWIVKKLATEFASRPRPMKILELGNELDGKFLGAGFYLPDELAALCSALYDGHENTITYKGEKVGVKNCGKDILMSMPGLTNINPEYFETMAFWFYWNRKDHKFASDVINAHAYPSTAGITASAKDGKGLDPENTIYNLEGKIAYLKHFRDSLAPHALVINSETGYDAFEEKVKNVNEKYCGSSVYGNSFVNVPNIKGQTIEQTHGNFIARTLLLHAAAELDFTCQFWLTDRFQQGTTCGTFGASGLLAIDTVIEWVPYYRKRLAYSYFRTIDTLLKGMEFISDNKSIISGNPIRLQQYRDVNNTGKILYALWSPTAANITVSNYKLLFTKPGQYKVIQLSGDSETGIVSASGRAKELLLGISERPVFVQFQPDN